LNISNLATFTKYTVKKIIFGINHCLIQFNGKNELGLLGSNDNGQLGLDYYVSKPSDDPQFNLNYYSEIKLKQLEIESTTDYDILDITTCDRSSLILIKFRDTNKNGSHNIIYKFELDTEEFLKIPNEEIKIKTIKTIKREEIKYGKLAKIRQIYLRNSILLKGVNFNLEPLESFKLIVDKFEKKINYLCIGNSHLLIFTGI
jgi:hypothetical protein